MVLTQTSSITDGLEFAEGDEKDSGYNSINGTNIDCSLQDLLDPNGKYFVKETYNITVNDDIADAIGIGHAFVNQLNNEINWE
jgi:hypothetical protein